MRRVVSVSIGSSKRDNQAVVQLCGEEFSIERIGTDGDIGRAIDLIRDLDGKGSSLRYGRDRPLLGWREPPLYLAGR